MKRNISLIIVALIVSLTASAQSSRKYIKDKIDEWGSCRNVAITLTGGDIALNQTNAYAYSGIPTGLAEAIKELHADGEFIDDIQLTEDGSWLILYGDNGFRWDGIPSDLETVIRQYNRDQEVVTSVTFNDKGDWIVISQEHINASNSSIYDWIQSGIDKFGQLWAAHLTDDGMVVRGDVNPLISTDIKTLPYPGFPTDIQSPFMAFLTTVQGRSIVIETVFENRYMHVLELNSMGARIKTEGKCAIVEGSKKLHGTEVNATDLRAGAALVLAGFVAEGQTIVSDIYHIERGYEKFIEKFAALGGKITRVED